MEQEEQARVAIFPDRDGTVSGWYTRVWSLIVEMHATSCLRAALVQHSEDEPQAFNDSVGSFPRSDFTVDRQELCTACRHALQEGIRGTRCHR
jgi:hypothetical protein